MASSIIEFKHQYPATSGTGYTFTNAVQVGDVMVISVSHGSGGSGTTVTDNLGNIYTRQKNVSGGNTCQSWIFTAPVKIAGTPTLTVTTAATDLGWSGFIARGPISATPEAIGGISSTGTLLQVSLTTTVQCLLFLFWANEAADNFTSWNEAGMTADNHDAGHWDANAHKLAVVAGSYTPGVNVTTAIDNTFIALYLPETPQISVQPAPIFSKTGDTATFAIQATGATSYQWQVNAGTWADITGATNPRYTTDALTLASLGYLYRCNATNANGTTASNSATLYVFTTDVYLRSVPSDSDPDDVRLYNPNSADATGNQTLTQSIRFDNTSSFYTHVLTPGVVALAQTAQLDNTNTFYTHVLTQGGVAQNLTQTARFDNSNTFYTHVLSATIGLVQSSRFDNSQTFYTHSLSVTIGLTQAPRFDNAQTFYTHSLNATIALSQSARFDNTPSFYTHALNATITLVQSSRFDNSNAFYTHVLTQDGGAQTLVQSSRFDNANGFYTHLLTPGVVVLSQSARFENSNAFYTHVLMQDGGDQALTQAARFDNSNAFYTHTVDQIYSLPLTTTQAKRLEAIWRLHGLGSPLVVTSTSRGDGTITQTMLGTGPVTVTTTDMPAAQQPLASWVDDLARWYGLIDPMVESAANRTDGILSQSVVIVGDITTVTRL